MSKDTRFVNTVQDLIELVREVKDSLANPFTLTEEKLTSYIGEAFRVHREMESIGVDDETLEMAETLVIDLCNVTQKVFGTKALSKDYQNKLKRISKRIRAA